MLKQKTINVKYCCPAYLLNYRGLQAKACGREASRSRKGAIAARERRREVIIEGKGAVKIGMRSSLEPAVAAHCHHESPAMHRAREW